MTALQVCMWCSAVILTVYGAKVAATVQPTSSPNQELIFGLVGQQMNSQAREGVEDALDDINNDTELLSGYKLKYFHTPVPVADVCSREVALAELFPQLFNSSHRIVALINLGCPESNEATAELSHYYNIIQVVN